MKIKTEKLATENTEVTEVTEMTGGTSTIQGGQVGSCRIKSVGKQAAHCSAIAFSVTSVFSVAKSFSK
jgi:hypothetical protein